MWKWLQRSFNSHPQNPLVSFLNVIGGEKETINQISCLFIENRYFTSCDDSAFLEEEPDLVDHWWAGFPGAEHPTTLQSLGSSSRRPLRPATSSLLRVDTQTLVGF